MDNERTIADAFFNSIDTKQTSVQESIPIKPVSSWLKNAKPLTSSPKIIGATPRMAKAIAASAIANKVILMPKAEVPRLLEIDGVQFIFENGCAREMIKAGLVKAPREGTSILNERMELTEYGFDFVREVIGNVRLIELGILEPSHLK